MNYVLVAIGVLAAMWVLFRVFSGNWNIWKLVEGADGKPSVSKLQWFLWLGAIVASYAVLWLARALGPIGTDAINSVPTNVLTVLGLSGATMATAKAVTANYVAAGRIEKPQSPDPSPAHLVNDDGGYPDLSKLQILSFTVIGIVVYVLSVAAKVQAIAVLTAKPEDTSLYGLPDIDPALMVMMGLSQAAYLGKKLTTADTPRLTSLDPVSAAPNATVSVRGISLGAATSGGILILDDAPIPTRTWADGEVAFDVPPTHPTRGAWKADGQVVQLKLVSSGHESANSLPMTVKPVAPLTFARAEHPVVAAATE